jgi:predicted RNase H-like nuclease (RuvC/YqgF family)
LNILTKIGIVVLVVVSLFISTVFITHASVTPKWAKEARENETRANINAMHYANQVVANQKLQKDLEQAGTSIAQMQDQAKKDKQDSEKALQDVKNQLQAADRNLVAQQSNVERLTVATTSLTDRLKDTSEALTATRKNNDQLADENRKLTQTVQETTVRLEREARQSEYYQDQISDLQKQVEEARRSPGAAPARGTSDQTGVAPTSEERYTGSVTSVKGELASINIGTSNGVKKGDKLFVYRGGKFLAYLKVEEVDANNSAGVVTDRQGEIAQGDKVTNKLQ